jgi:hypothetical protein
VFVYPLVIDLLLKCSGSRSFIISLAVVTYSECMEFLLKVQVVKSWCLSLHP